MLRTGVYAIGGRDAMTRPSARRYGLAGGFALLAAAAALLPGTGRQLTDTVLPSLAAAGAAALALLLLARAWRLRRAPLLTLVLASSVLLGNAVAAPAWRFAAPAHGERDAMLLAGALLASALAFWLQRIPRSGRRAAPQLAAMLAALALVLAIAVLGLHAGPAGWAEWPVLLTAAALGALALGLLRDAGAGSWLRAGMSLIRRGIGTAMPPGHRGALVATIVLITTTIGAAGYVYIVREQAQARRSARDTLMAIADLKTQGISALYRQWLADAALLSDTSEGDDPLHQALGGRADRRAREGIARWMAGFIQRYGYRSITLFDADGRLCMAAPVQGQATAALTIQARAMAQRRGVQIEDLQRDPATGTVRLNLWIPLPAGSASPPTSSGVLLLQVDPGQALYPALASWPIPSASAESLLVRREGDSVLFLNTLRHRQDAALRLRLPLTGTRGLPALLAASGQQGSVEGLDYRGVPVLSVVRSVPATPWFLVVKVDQAEIYAAARQRAWTLALLVGALALLGMLAVLAVWRQRGVRVLKRELELQRARALSDLRYRRLVENMHEGLTISDREGRLTYLNERVLEMYGLTREQAGALRVEDLVAPEQRAPVRDRHDRRVAGEAVAEAFEAQAVRTDGSRFWIDVRVSRLVDDGVLIGTQSTIQDISERKRSERIHGALLEISEAAHAATDMVDLYRRIHDVVGGLLPARNFFVALYDQATDKVSFPYFIDQHDPQPQEESLGEISLTAIVLRSGQPLLLTSAMRDERARCGEPMVGTPPVEWLGVPLVADTRTIGALVVQSYDEAIRYSERDKALLQFVGTQIANTIERKRAASDLRANEEQFRAVFDQSPDLIALVSLPEGRIVEVNRAALLAYQRPREQIVGKTAIELGLWASPDERARYVELLLSHRSIRDFEAALKRPDGKRFYALMNGNVVTINGQPFALISVRDVTARKQAEQRLSESAAAVRNLELALDQHAIVAITDPKGSITYVNDKFCAISGYSREELIGADHRLVNSGYHSTEFFRDLWSTIAHGKVWKGELRNRAKSEAIYWVDSTLVPFLDAAGSPHQYVAIHTDISERKRAEQWQRHYAHTLGLIAAETPLDSVLESIASFAEQHSDNAFCVVRLHEGEQRRPVRGAAAAQAVAAALAAIDASGVAADGDASRLLQLGHGDRLVDILPPPDAASATDIGERARAANTGFRSCALEPITAADQQVLGAIALYRQTPATPQPEQMALLRESAGLAALAIERAHHQSEQRLAKVVFEQSVEGILLSDHSDRIVMVNPAFEQLTGYPASEVIGRSPDLLQSNRHEPAFFEQVRAALASEDGWQGEVWIRHRSGESRPVWLSIVMVRDAVGVITHRIRVMSDISEQKFQAARIEQLAFYDSLTGLPNRALFLDRLEHTLEAARRHGQHGALLFLDLDRFKEINDSQGHAVGDQALVEVARRFVAVARKEETVARLGGDEFVLIAEGARQAAAALIAERLQRVLADPLQVAETTLVLAASIGIALYPDDGDSVKDLIKHADIAMYRAKGEGGGFRFYQPVMGESLRKRLDLARRLERALEGGSLQLHYQPQVSLATRRLSGAEALLRWQDPELGWVSPAEFIPLAEERGMIGALGEWVFREACRQLAAWQTAGHVMAGRLAINLSALQLQLPNIVHTLVAQVENAGLGTHQFELELTESSMMANPEGAIATMDALHRAGFSLAVDDFGTGYSSLVYLKHFAADNIKIDISFVRDMLTNRNDAAIVSTIIAMARNLGLNTTAEGVETPQQAQALLELGCDFAQGYHFGRPEAADVFASRWLSAGLAASAENDR